MHRKRERDPVYMSLLIVAILFGFISLVVMGVIVVASLHLAFVAMSEIERSISWAQTVSAICIATVFTLGFLFVCRIVYNSTKLLFREYRCEFEDS